MGGPRAQAAGAARLSCCESALPLFPPALLGSRGLSGGLAGKPSPRPRAERERRLPGAPPCARHPRSPTAGGTAPWPQERGGNRSLHAGAQIFGRGAEEYGFVCHSRGFVNIWPATRVVTSASASSFLEPISLSQGLP